MGAVETLQQVRHKPKRTWSSVIPIGQWARGYDRAWLRPDVIAGVTLAAFTIPEAMAYAGLAGLPPQAGLYAALIAPIAYLIFGTSRQLSLGPTSALSIMVASGLSVIAFADPSQYAAAAAVTAILVAIICFIAWLLRLGFLVNFISEAVLVGFSSGAALYIASTQLGKLFGIHGSSGEFFERIAYILQHLDETNLPTLLLGLAGIVILLVMEEKLPRWPSALIVVLGSIALMSFSNLAARGVAVTGAIPSGLPTPQIPKLLDLNTVRLLLPLAFSVFMLAYVEGMSMARTFADKHHYRVDADQELLALGMSNLGAGLFQGFPIGGSMSRSAVGDKSGARSPLVGGVAALGIAVVLLFLTGLFTNLPETILAAVVIVAVKGLFKTKALRHLYRVNRIEFWIALVVLFGVLLFGMLEGVLIGVIVSLLLLAYRAALPNTAVLGRIPGTDQFSDLERHPANEELPGVLLYRPDAALFYANAPVIREQLAHLVAALEPRPKLVVLDLAGTPHTDLSAVDMLRDLHTELQAGGTVLKLAEVAGPVRDLLKADGQAERFGLTNARQSVQQVIAASAAMLNQ
jgi:sulfate permease, SulP family